MRAVVMNTWGDPDVLGVQSIPIPAPGDGEVRIKVEAAAANPVDALLRDGVLAQFIPGIDLPRTPGVDVAGVIDAVGPDVSAFRPGDPVVAMVLSPRQGTFAEYVNAPVDTTAKRPAGVTAEDGATVPMAGLTALAGVDMLGLRDPGAVSSLYVNGALGAVGGYAIQIAAHLGIEVIGAARPAQADQVRALGATHVVDRDGDIAEQIRALYPDGVDYAFEVVGGAAAHSAVAALRDGGRFSTTLARGQVEGSPHTVQLGRGIVGTTVFTASNADGVYVASRPDGLQYLVDLMGQNVITARIHSRHTLDDSVQVHRLLATAGLIGKIVVSP